MRFPEFSGEWNVKRLDECVTFLDEQRKPIKSTERSSEYKLYPYYGASGVIDYVDDYIFNEELILLSEDGANILDRNYRVAFIVKGKTWVNNHAHVLRPMKNVDISYLSEYLESLKYEKYNTGSTMPKLNQEVCRSIKILLPEYAEQVKIGILLSAINERIATQIKIIEDLKKLKSAIRAKVFKQLESSCEFCSEIGNMLQYEQPSKYLVTSTEYSDSYTTPVLTANKAFILGYTDEEFGIYSKGECVIFDDFTMDVKYVNFPFKVKSSAIKILTANSGNDLYFVYEYLQNLGLVSEEHKRHYISEIEPMVVACPTFEEQQNISNLFRSFDSKIECANRELILYNKQKQHLLSQMFI